MRRYIVSTALLLAAVAPSGSIAQQSPSRVVEVDVPAPSLAGNRVGSETTQPALVYLPAGYDDDATRRYPVLYLLHGIFDRPETWTEHFQVPAMLDRLIGRGALPAVIVVMPSGGNRYGGGYYRDSPVTGRWATHIARDLVGFIDGRFRTRAAPHARAILGHSMGGFGAIHVPMEFPGVFSVAYAMSPCCLAPIEDVGLGNVAWRSAFGWSDLADYEAALEAREFYPVAVMGVLAAFAPDTTAGPFFVDFPFELVRGEAVVDEAEWLAFVERFPVSRVDERRAALTSLRALAMDYGTGDQFVHIPAGTLLLSQRLGELRVPHLLDVYAGDHREQLAGRMESFVLPWVGRALGAE